MSNQEPEPLKDTRQYWLCPACHVIAPWGGTCKGTPENPHPEAVLLELRLADGTSA